MGHDRAPKTVKCVPQAVLVGVCDGNQPYLRARASLKEPYVVAQAQR